MLAIMCFGLIHNKAETCKGVKRYTLLRRRVQR
jgi:hypothetical protein